MVRANTWSKKRKFTGVRSKGQHASGNPNLQNENLNSSSRAKINNVSHAKYSRRKASSMASSGYRLISLELLNACLLSTSCCAVCKLGTLSITEDLKQRRGWASKLFVTCGEPTCKYTEPFYTSKTLPDSGKFEVNSRLTYAMRCIGKGQMSSKVVSAVMDMPPPLTTFQHYNADIRNATHEVCMESMERAAGQSVVANSGNADLTVTGDGSWMRRGHTSRYGATTVIAANTGKVLDTEVSSKYCHSCAIHSKLDKKSVEYVSWAEKHESKCKINYVGASGGMEVSGALAIFNRSEAKNGVRYTRYISDGDSRAFNAVVEAKPYGDGVTMEKLECIGHVQKRMGSRLRKLRTTMKGKRLSDNKILSGKGRLTDKHIDSLQYYYGAAIRSNTESLDSMKKAVWATFLHKASSDEKPQHQLCPKGEETWCKYNRSQLDGSEYHHANSLPLAVVEAIKPTYKDLAKPELLAKCLHGKTQNPNESLNGLIWDRCPKVKFAGRETVEAATYDAISYFNDGNLSKKLVLNKLGITAGYWCEGSLREMDAARIFQCDNRAEERTKEARVKRRRRAREQADAEQEEDYVPGGF